MSHVLTSCRTVRKSAKIGSRLSPEVVVSRESNQSERRKSRRSARAERRLRREAEASNRRITLTLHGIDEDDDDGSEPVCGLYLRPDGPEYWFDRTGHRIQVLGRSEQANIRVDDDAVSHLHALIERGRYHVYVHDSHSHNGTYVNGLETAMSALCVGATLRVGGTHFLVMGADGLDTKIGLFVVSHRDYLEKAVKEFGNPHAAAKGIGVVYTTLRDWMKKLEEE